MVGPGGGARTGTGGGVGLGAAAMGGLVTGGLAGSSLMLEHVDNLLLKLACR